MNTILLSAPILVRYCVQSGPGIGLIGLVYDAYVGGVPRTPPISQESGSLVFAGMGANTRVMSAGILLGWM